MRNINEFLTRAVLRKHPCRDVPVMRRTATAAITTIAAIATTAMMMTSGEYPNALCKLQHDEMRD